MVIFALNGEVKEHNVFVIVELGVKNIQEIPKCLGYVQHWW